MQGPVSIRHVCLVTMCATLALSFQASLFASAIRAKSKAGSKSSHLLASSKGGSVSGQTATCTADGSTALELVLEHSSAKNHVTVECPPEKADPNADLVSSKYVPTTPGHYCKSGSVANCAQDTTIGPLTDLFPRYNATWLTTDTANPHKVTLTIPTEDFPQVQSRFTVGCQTTVTQHSAARTGPGTPTIYNCDVHVTVKGGAAALLSTGTLLTTVMFVAVSTVGSA